MKSIMTVYNISFSFLTKKLIIFSEYLGIAEQFPAWMKEESQTFRGTLQGKRTREKDDNQEER